MRRTDKSGNKYDAWGIVTRWNKAPSAYDVRPTRSEYIAAFEKSAGMPRAKCRRVFAASCVKVSFEVVEKWKPWAK